MLGGHMSDDIVPETLLSQTLRRVQPSATIAMSQKARAMRAAGKDVIILSQGEPDFDTPEYIRAAAREALETGQTRYTAVDGTPALKAAICEKFSRDNGLDYDPENINVSPGGKAVIFNALKATLNPGDEVIISTPCWVSYPEMVRLCGGNPVIIPCGPAEDYKLSASALEASITPRTKWVILNSPSNPTGVLLSKADLIALGEVIKRHPHVLVLSDDIYEHLTYQGAKFYTLAQLVPELNSRTLTMNGMSKAYAMTGWRIGYGAGPAWLISAMRKVMGQSTSNPSSISQWAAMAALNGSHDFLEDWRAAFEARRALVLQGLKRSGLDARPPDGAFYVFANCENSLGLTSAGGRKLVNDVDFADALLDEVLIAVVPGSAFHAPGHFRLSFASDLDSLKQALARIERFCKGLH